MLQLRLGAGRACRSPTVPGTGDRPSPARRGQPGTQRPEHPSGRPPSPACPPPYPAGEDLLLFWGEGTPKQALGLQDKVTEGPQREWGGHRSIMAHPVSAFQAAYISIEVLIALVSVPGNILVIWAVKMNQALRDATFCFIVSLAVADVAVGALVIPLAIIINIGPQTEFYSCLMVACPVLILTESSILALLAIAVDRYLRVKIPVRYKSVVTPRRAAVAIACCWIVSFLVGLTPMFGWNNLNKMRRTQELNASHTEFVIKCQFETVISMEYMVYFNFFVWVLPPLLLMLLIYLEVFNLIRKQLNKKVSSSSNDPQKYYGKELKIAKSLALVLFLFALSWLPLHVLNCITLFCPSCETPHILTYIAIFLTHGNSAMNPIVYAFRIKKFRTAFLQIWNQYFCCKTNKNTSTTTAEPGT